jgi:uncharacterized protein (TIGR02147 family)
MTINEFGDYRSYLKAALSKKIEHNPQYSIRAFARQADLAPGFISEVLRGKKNLSYNASMKVTESLGLSSKESEYFQTLVQLESAQSPELKLKLSRKLESLFHKNRSQNLSLETFRAMSDWYHVAIVELTEIQGLILNAENVSRLLGISRIEAVAAIDRLERAGLIVQNSAGRFIKGGGNPILASKERNEALQNFHRQMLARASVAVQNQTNSEKFIGSETVAINPKDLPKFAQIFEDCFSKILELAEKSKSKSHVYHLGIQFFDLTRGSKS